MSKMICGIVFIAVMVLSVLSATAFTPADEEIAARLKKNYGQLASWEAEMTFPGFPDVTVHVWFSRGKWRQEWAAGATAIAVGFNGVVAGNCTAEGFVLSPLFVWMPQDPMSTWAHWGVKTATSSYGFCGDQPCLMLGADPENKTLPAIFLNNEEMTPQMVRFFDGSQAISIQYADYHKVSGFQMPQTVTVAIAGQLLEAKVKWISVNRADGEELYASEGLASTLCATPPPPFDFLRDSFHYPSVQ